MDEFAYCLGRFAEDLCLAGYKKWARKIYKIAEGKFNRGQMDESFSLLNLANDVAQNLGDKKWASKIYKEAEKDDEVGGGGVGGGSEGVDGGVGRERGGGGKGGGRGGSEGRG